MDQRFEQLLLAARSGEEDDFLALLRAVEQDQTVDAATIVGFCRSDDPILRRLGVELGANRREPEVLEALAQLVDDGEEAVRKALAGAMTDVRWWPDDAVVGLLLEDRADAVRLLAVKACLWRPTLANALLGNLSKDRAWTVREAVAECLERHDSRQVAAGLLAGLCLDDDVDVAYACAASLETHIRNLGGYPAEFDRPAVDKLNLGLERAGRCPRRCVDQLRAWLEETCRVEVDLTQVRAFGSVLTEKQQLSQLPRAFEIDDVVEAVEQALHGAVPRAVVLLGPSGAGKSAIVGELAHRLAGRGWHMVRVSPSDFLTGTVYLGEWQTRLSKLIAAVSRPRPIVVYLPNLEELHSVGKSSSTDSNVATALAPYIERGEIVLVGETTEEGFQQGLGSNPALRKLFRPIVVKPLGETATRLILERVAQQAKLDLAPGVLNRILELSDFVNVASVLPGRAVDLLKRVAGGLRDRGGPSRSGISWRRCAWRPAFRSSCSTTP